MTRTVKRTEEESNRTGKEEQGRWEGSLLSLFTYLEQQHVNYILRERQNEKMDKRGERNNNKLQRVV